MNIHNSAKAQEFYADSLKILNKSKIPYMVGGTLAVAVYTGIDRPTKDMDIFCKASDYPKILSYFRDEGYKTEATDERWLAKVHQGRYYLDFIFNSANAAIPVTDEWLKESQGSKIFDVSVKLLPPTELIWSKVFVQHRNAYHGADVAHMILIKNKDVNWQRLLSYMDHVWEVLFIHILNFRFIYPSEREKIPKWLFDELLNRLNHQMNLPTQQTKICRGRLFSREDYQIDITQWGYTDIVG